MIKTILICLEENDLIKKSEKTSFFSKVAGLSILKRILLTFQFSGGKNSIIILPKTLSPLVEQELKDKRIALNIHFFDPAEIDRIKSALKEGFIFVAEKAIFEHTFLTELLQKKPGETGYSISIKNKFPELQGNEKIIRSGFYFLSPGAIEQYHRNDFSTDCFLNWINKFPFKAISLGEKFYIRIDSKKSIRSAEKGLFKFLTKSNDTFISRNINRSFSLFITRFLMHTPITPNMITMVTLGISLLSVFFILLVKPGLEGYIYGVIGGFLLHTASVVDGCDGELARLKFQFSKTGEWLDGFIDDFKNVLFGIALGIRLYWSYLDTNTGLAEVYFFAAWIFGISFFLAKTLQYSHLFLSQSGSMDISEYKYFFEETGREKKATFFVRTIAFLSNFARSDALALFAMVMGVLNLYNIAFWFFCAFSVGMFFLVLFQTVINRKKLVATKT